MLSKIKKIINSIFKILYKISSEKVRQLIQKIIVKYDGGEFWSTALREIYSKNYNIKIGIGTYGCFDVSRFPCDTVFGNYCSVADGVKYLNANHPIDFVSTHPMFYNKKLGFIKCDKIKRNSLTVGNDVWIGYGTIILAKCTHIGDGAVIAAGSIVTNDIEAYTIYAGVPARPIRKRFTDEIIEGIEYTNWYNMSPKELLMYQQEIENPEIFINIFNNKGKNDG